MTVHIHIHDRGPAAAAAGLISASEGMAFPAPGESAALATYAAGAAGGDTQAESNGRHVHAEGSGLDGGSPAAGLVAEVEAALGGRSQPGAFMAAASNAHDAGAAPV